jgi:hypothetical protein
LLGCLRKTSINKVLSAVLRGRRKAAVPEGGGAELAARVGFQFLLKLSHIDAQVLGVICVSWSSGVRKDALHVFAWMVQ